MVLLRIFSSRRLFYRRRMRAVQDRRRTTINPGGPAREAVMRSTISFASRGLRTDRSKRAMVLPRYNLNVPRRLVYRLTGDVAQKDRPAVGEANSRSSIEWDFYILGLGAGSATRVVFSQCNCTETTGPDG